MELPKLTSAEDLAELVEEIGFLPFFRSGIEGFSVEECTPPELWFTDEEGPWEWKGPVIRSTHCAYGKFFRGKAMYISGRLFPNFANFRRDGYDYDARMDEGLARHVDVPVMQALWREPSLVSKQLKTRACFSKESRVYQYRGLCVPSRQKGEAVRVGACAVHDAGELLRGSVFPYRL